MTEMPKLSEPAPQAPKLVMLLIVILLALMALTMILRIFADFSWSRLSAASALRDGKIIEQYTRFRTVLLDRGKVVTGYKYARSTDAVPNEQYCYLQTIPPGAQVISQITLANKNGGGPAIFETILPEQARQLGLAADEAEKIAHEHCRFDEWE